MMASQTGRSGIHGVLNGRDRYGSLCLRIITPAQTSTKANSVPMFVSSTILSSGENRAKKATKIPVQIVVTCGVRYFGWTRAKILGSSPSRDMEKKMRDGLLPKI